MLLTLADQIKPQGIKAKSSTYELRRNTELTHSTIVVLTLEGALVHILVVKARNIIETSKKTPKHFQVDKKRTTCSCVECRTVDVNDLCVHCGSARGCTVYYPQWVKFGFNGSIVKQYLKANP